MNSTSQISKKSQTKKVTTKNTVTKTPRHLRQLCPFGPPCDSYRRMRSAGGGCGFRRPTISLANKSKATNITTSPTTPQNTPHTKPNCTSWFQNSAHVTCLAITGHLSSWYATITANAAAIKHPISVPTSHLLRRQNLEQASQLLHPHLRQDDASADRVVDAVHNPLA
jgi:hypothetical protein